MKRATGLLCMIAGGAGFLYALYLLLSPAWAILCGAFFLYVIGYYLYMEAVSFSSRMGNHHKRVTERTMKVVTDAAHDSTANGGDIRPLRSARKTHLN